MDDRGVNVMGDFVSLIDGAARARAGSCGDDCIDQVRCRRDGVCWREAKARLADERDQRTWTEPRILAAIRRHVAEHGEAPRCNDWSGRDPDGLRPTASTVAHVLGSWNDGIAAAGEAPRSKGGPTLETRREPQAWTKETAIAAIQAHATEHGAPPKSVEWQRYGEAHPNAVMVAKLFGSWSAGIEAAGFERPRQGRQRLSAGAAEIASDIESKEPELSMVEPEKLEPGEPQVRQEPPVVWAVKVPDTGLRYRTPDEAYIAAAEIEHDGETVADRARKVGDDDKAEQAWDAAHELAEKVRAAARHAAGDPEPEPEASSELAASQPTSDLRAAALGVIGALRTLLDAAEASLEESS